MLLLLLIIVRVSIILGTFYITTYEAGKIISRLLEPYHIEILKLEKEGKVPQGLKGAGKWIGYCERFLILCFILGNIPIGVGLLLAIKSFLRFGEIKETSQRKLAEYIIIGTFLSFCFGLGSGLVLKELLSFLTLPS